jgi:hypothetical protein
MGGGGAQAARTITPGQASKAASFAAVAACVSFVSTSRLHFNFLTMLLHFQFDSSIPLQERRDSIAHGGG